jgi:branched-chain amino acid transport system substrate-binding protein
LAFFAAARYNAHASQANYTPKATQEDRRLNAFIRRLGLFALVGLFIVSATVGCTRKDAGGGGNAGSATGAIKVGAYGSMTGNQAAYGESSINGFTLATEEINAAGGVLGGRKIELVTGDDQSKAEDAATVVTKLVTQDRVAAVLGEVASSNSLAAAPICQQNKIPMITPASTNVKVTQVGDFIFRVCFMDDFQGDVMSRFAFNTLKAKKGAILKDTKSDYSKGLTDSITNYFGKLGGTIAGAPLEYSQGDQDFRGQLTSIKSMGVDVIFIPGYYNDVGIIIKQARELGITVPIVGGDGWDSDPLFDIGGAALENCYYATHFTSVDPSPVVQTFVTNYKKKFGKEPDANAALAYDAAKLLADAFTRASGTDGEKVRDALRATRDYAGVTGTISIDAGGNAVKSATIIECKVDGGKAHRTQKESIKP